MTEVIYLGLGSNLGDREHFLSIACSLLQEVEGLEIVAISALYVTKPQEMPDGSPPFLNQVIKAEYKFTPDELLRAVEKIEQELGRTEKGECQPRTIDLDILLFGDRQINSDDLTIPHDKLLQRPFALIPLLQIDPDIIHPVSGKPLTAFVTTAGQSRVKLYKDQVARNV